MLPEFNINTDLLFALTELVGTAAFAVSGATTAIARGMDFFGVLFLGLTTGLGGGMIRDILLGVVPPQAFQNYNCVIVAAVTSVAVFAVSYVQARKGVPLRFIDSGMLNLLDAAGLGIFSVIGVQAAVRAGFDSNGLFCAFLGMTTGVGGGILRDVLSHSTPVVFRKEIYATASLGAAICFYFLRRVSETGAVLFCIAAVIVLRLLAVRYRWKLPKVALKGREEEDGD